MSPARHPERDPLGRDSHMHCRGPWCVGVRAVEGQRGRERTAATRQGRGEWQRRRREQRPATHSTVGRW
eukprot:COSAG02_NODE_4253_length_5584_cov_251.164995_3_plen_69_part_00